MRVVLNNAVVSWTRELFTSSQQPSSPHYENSVR